MILEIEKKEWAVWKDGAARAWDKDSKMTVSFLRKPECFPRFCGNRDVLGSCWGLFPPLLHDLSKLLGTQFWDERHQVIVKCYCSHPVPCQLLHRAGEPQENMQCSEGTMFLGTEHQRYPASVLQCLRLCWGKGLCLDWLKFVLYCIAGGLE